MEVGNAGFAGAKTCPCCQELLKKQPAFPFYECKISSE